MVSGHAAEELSNTKPDQKIDFNFVCTNVAFDALQLRKIYTNFGLNAKVKNK
jgi:hypothetical protein